MQSHIFQPRPFAEWYILWGVAQQKNCAMNTIIHTMKGNEIMIINEMFMIQKLQNFVVSEFLSVSEIAGQTTLILLDYPNFVSIIIHVAVPMAGIHHW